jgi:prepilin-type N-terminal cleavage/methylation domain-containing protein
VKSQIKNRGFSTIELLTVIAIIGILVGIAMLNGRQIISKQNEIASVQQFRQLINRAATGVNARGNTATLVRSGRSLKVIDSDNRTIAEMTLDSKVTTTIPEGNSLVFLITGRISSSSISAVNPVSFVAGGQTFNLHISAIGEVKTELQP